MSGEATLLLHALGAVLAVFALVTALAVATSRALFAMCLYLAATSVFTAVALLCFGAAHEALAVVLVGVGLAPVLMLGGLLLSERTPRTRAPTPRFVLLAVILVAGVLAWTTSDATPTHPPLAATGDIAAWLAPLVLVIGLVCTGLLGYGERGVFARAAAER